MSETLGLKNVNMLSKAQYDGVAEPATDELWLVEVEGNRQYKETVISWGMPDYSARVEKGWKNFTVDTNGWIYCTSGCATSTNYVYVNGGEVYRCGNNQYADYHGTVVPVSKGDEVTVGGGTYSIANIIFMPCKGVN